MPESNLKKYLVDILSLLALTMYAEGERESLKYRLLGSDGDIGSWGHEYVRNLAGEIAQEFQKRQYDDMFLDSSMELVQQIVAFHMKHNAEPEAVEFPMEVEDLDLLVLLDCKQPAICWHIQPHRLQTTCLDMKSIILGKYHYMLYILVLAMQPRMVMTVDENLNTLSVPVRVGQAIWCPFS